MALSLLRVSTDVHDDDERDSEAKITDLRLGALALFHEAQWGVDGLTLIVVRDGSERDLDEDSPRGEALLAHLVEISGPLAIVKLLSSRAVVGVTKLDVVAVRGRSSSAVPGATRAILARLRSAARAGSSTHRREAPTNRRCVTTGAARSRVARSSSPARKRGRVRHSTGDAREDVAWERGHCGARRATRYRQIRRSASRSSRRADDDESSNVGWVRCHGHTCSVGCPTRSMDWHLRAFSVCLGSCMVASCPIHRSRLPRRHKGISRRH